MNVLTTRVLKYTDDNGDEKDLVLTVFMPFEAEKDMWTCGFITDPPIRPKIVFARGVDFLDSFVRCLRTARINLETSDLGRRAHWGEMLDCGLPWHTAPTALKSTGDVLTTRKLRYRDEGGGEAELILTVFVPFKTEDESWKCAYAFGPPLNVGKAYSYGLDYTEALLSCLAQARESLEILDPFGKIYSINREDLYDFPRQIGRSFWMGTTDEAPPNSTDVPAG